ncbi:MAG TPA: hypothetical protein VKZ96_12695, partial [Thermomicrobiales bacterium]|nr:hypothetical protein [Thermomicrobiales bacterium]
MSERAGETTVWRDYARPRIMALLIVFSLFVCLIVARAIQVQVVNSQELSGKASAERLVVDTVPARRGDILDSRGTLLATDLPSARIWAIIPNIEDRQH